MPALLALIREATNLSFLNIDSSNLDEEEQGQQLIAALKESESKSTLKFFSWSYDAFELNEVIEEILEVLGDSEEFPELKQIELVETHDSGAKRNALRHEFKDKGIKLILSDR